ncbi:MAG: hypothetical protein EOO10_18015 [Chitinophagaceae bacterium]|nr:MAG: hypothetical protein EOO10_18015 [Chitinophagaceae bacterium]
MQKVYLLLRNNQQTGPYSLEEIIQFDLKPFDLIWIEGRSAGWYYPQEIQALQPHLSFLKHPTTPPVINPVSSVEKPKAETEPKKVFVSMPSNTVAEKPTPKPSFSSPNNDLNVLPKTPEPVFAKRETEELTTAYSKSLQEVETDYMNWVYKKKKNRKSPVSVKGAVVACLFVGVVFAGWMIVKPSAENPVKTPAEQTAFLSSQNELPADSVKEDAPSTEEGKAVTNKKVKQTKVKLSAESQTKSAIQQVQKGSKETVAVVNKPAENDYEIVPEIKEESNPVVEEKKSEPVAVEAPKEKKKLRDKIADLFKKKPEEKKEEAVPAEEENGERRSVRREAGSNLAQLMTVKFAIPNDWMMGIKGAKATLANRSSETIVKAVVEVIYYNDDNDVLDKKTVSFSNIKSKQTQTISIPDHQTATRLEYNVVSATGAGEPFAKR